MPGKVTDVTLTFDKPGTYTFYCTRWCGVNHWRMRGVVEKCNLCHARMHEAQDRAAAAGRREIDPADYVPSCVEACPAHAIVFGDLADPSSEVARLAKGPNAFRLLARLGTEPKVFYHSEKPWVRALADRGGAAPAQEESRG